MCMFWALEVERTCTSMLYYNIPIISGQAVLMECESRTSLCWASGRPLNWIES